MLALNNRVRVAKNRKRVGRGGKRGGTSLRGHKGQKARSGGSVGSAFEGGQMPLARRLPKRGFNNKRFQVEYVIVNLDTLNSRFNEGDEVTKQALVDCGVLKKSHIKANVKVLGGGALEKKLTVYADKMSKSAREALENLGGEVHITKGE
jgi:large subunit ribosomal protein L15